MSFKDFIYRKQMAPRGLRHKLWATFALGTVIPLLLFLWILQEHAFKFYPRISVGTNLKLLNPLLRFLPMEKFPNEISFMLIVIVMLALFGIYFTRNIINRILSLTKETRTIVQHSDFTHEIRLMSEDEIGELRDTLNFIINRLQQNMQELSEYEKRLITSEKEKYRLLEKTRTLTVKDEVTGLYNAQYFRECWKEEIRRATLFQHPCSLLFLVVGGIQNSEESIGGEKAQLLFKEIGTVIKKSLKGIEKAAHIQPGEFMIILPERNKNEAIVEGEVIIKKMQDFTSRENGNFTLNGGVVSSPIDGVESAELIAKAKEAVERVHKESPGQVVGF